MALHLRIAEFKFTHNFIICNLLPKMELTFGIDLQRKFSLSYAWDKERNCSIQKEGKYLTYTNICLEQGKKLLHSKGREIFNLH